MVGAARRDGRRDGRWLRALVALVTLGLGPAVGCNGRLDLRHGPATSQDAAPQADGAGMGEVAPVVDAPVELPPIGTDGTGAGAIDVSMSSVDAPVGDGSTGVDGPVDLARDVILDIPAGPDVPLGIDAARDQINPPVDAPAPTGCVSDGDCKLPGLHCLQVPGQPGRCVECTGIGHCALNAVNRLCDLVLNRCVECVTSTDCPSPSAIYPSVCMPVSHRCQAGCEDDLTTACPTTRNYRCVDDLYKCVECQTTADCVGSPYGSVCHPSEYVCVQCLATSCSAGMSCDPITARCVQCRTWKDCLNPAMPLCDPATYTCVAVPP